MMSEILPAYFKCVAVKYKEHFDKYCGITGFTGDTLKDK